MKGRIQGGGGGGGGPLGSKDPPLALINYLWTHAWLIESYREMKRSKGASCATGCTKRVNAMDLRSFFSGNR